MRMVGLAVLGLVVVAGSAIGLYRFALPPEPASVTAPVSSASPEASLFEFFEQPRVLPELRFTDASGAALTLADFRGKVLVLNLWATWCVPCRKEMPTLDRLQAKLGGADFEVVTLSLDRDGQSKVQGFYEKTGIARLKIYIEESSGAVSRDLNVIGLPTTLLIDRKGRELGRLIGPAEWDSPAILGVIKRAVEASSMPATEPIRRNVRFPASGTTRGRQLALGSTRRTVIRHVIDPSCDCIVHPSNAMI